MEGCTSRCIKYLLIVFNVFFMIFGIVLIAKACEDMGMIHGFAATDEAGHGTDAVLIAVGVLIIVVASFGCFGAWKESPKLLYIFVSCLVLIILLELSVGIAAAVYRPKIQEAIQTNLRVSFIKNKSSRVENSRYREVWDNIQANLHCCGVTGPDNYHSSDPSTNPTYSCCPADGSDNAVEIKRSDCLKAESYYKDGCEEKILSAIHTAGKAVIVCAILFCFVEIAGIVLAVWLAHAIKRHGKNPKNSLNGNFT